MTELSVTRGTQQYVEHIHIHCEHLCFSACSCVAASYTTSSYSSLLSTTQMKCPGASSSALSSSITADRLRRINWMLNRYFYPPGGVNPTCTLPATVSSGTWQSKTTTAPGTYPAATSSDIQAAVWALTGQNRYANNLSSRDNVVNCILWNTSNAGNDGLPKDGLTCFVLVQCCLGGEV